MDIGQYNNIAYEFIQLYKINEITVKRIYTINTIPDYYIILYDVQTQLTMLK